MLPQVRDVGFNFNIPDDEMIRCRVCNPDGMNRTGWKEIGFVGSMTSFSYAIDCPQKCRYGLLVKKSI